MSGEVDTQIPNNEEVSTPPMEKIAPWLIDDDEGGKPEDKPQEKPEDKPQEKPEGKEGEEKPRRKGPPEHIPYSRFQEVNNKWKDSQARLKELEDKVAKYEPKVEPIDPDSIDPRQYKSVEEFRKAHGDLVRASLRATLKAEADARVEAVRQEQYFTKLTQDFASRADNIIKERPEVAKSMETLGSIAKVLPPHVRMELLQDDNGPLLAHDILNDDDLYDIVTSGTEREAIRALQKRSAKWDVIRESKGGDEKPEGGRREETPSHRPEPPRIPKATPKGDVKDTLSGQEYLRRFRAGKIVNKPWED